MDYYAKYRNYKEKYLLNSGSNRINFDLPGPKGTFGKWVFSTKHPDKATKISLKSKNKPKIIFEASVYQQVYQLIKKLNLTTINTLQVDDINGQLIFTRLYPPLGSKGIIEIDYSTQYEGDDDNPWKVISPQQALSQDLMLSSQIEESIPYELGKIWTAMLFEYKRVIWEPELAIVTTDFNKDENQLFFIDFDKTREVSDDYKMAHNLGQNIPIYFVLTNVFPSPNSDYYDAFTRGIKEVGEIYNRQDIVEYILNGIEELFKSQT